MSPHPEHRFTQGSTCLPSLSWSPSPGVRRLLLNRTQGHAVSGESVTWHCPKRCSVNGMRNNIDSPVCTCRSQCPGKRVVLRGPPAAAPRACRRRGARRERVSACAMRGECLGLPQTLVALGCRPCGFPKPDVVGAPLLGTAPPWGRSASGSDPLLLWGGPPGPAVYPIYSSPR